MSRPPPLAATKTDLLQRVTAFYDSDSFPEDQGRIPRFSRGSVYKGEIVDYSDFKGYIDFRKPGDIRIVTLLPVFYTIANGDGVGRRQIPRPSHEPESASSEGEDDASPASRPIRWRTCARERSCPLCWVKPMIAWRFIPCRRTTRTRTIFALHTAEYANAAQQLSGVLTDHHVRPRGLEDYRAEGIRSGQLHYQRDEA